MNTSAENNNLEVFPGNKTGGIHSRKSLISPNNEKKEKTQHKTKKNLQSQKMRSAFETGDWEVCLKFQAEETSVNKDHTKKGLDRRLKIWCTQDII